MISTVPGFVTNVSISYTSSTSLSLSWEPPNDPWCSSEPYRYGIQYQLLQKGQCNTDSTNRCTLPNSRQRTADVTDLEPFSNYRFYLQAMHNTHNGRIFTMNFKTNETGKDAFHA